MLALAAIILVALISQPGLAQDTLESGDRSSQSGYENDPDFGGPEGVSRQLKENDEERPSIYEFDNLQQALGPYFDWKRQLNNDHGLSFGTSLYFLYQNASESLADDDALGGIFRYQGAWNFIGRGANNPGRINWRLESRFDVGSFQAPSQLSGTPAQRIPL